MKRVLKIIGKIILGIISALVLLFAIIYFTYNEKLPQGTTGDEADALANKMLTALNYEAYKNTRYLEWTFKSLHHYKWDKQKQIVEVTWDDVLVNLHLQNYNASAVFINNVELKNNSEKYIQKAVSYFNNDSFWLVAPYKVFDNGVQRSIVTLEDESKALLVTYTSGGDTPGDSYLWILDENYRPKGYKMWVKIIPIGGLYATWDQWKTTKSGAVLSTDHTLLFLNLDMGNVKAWN